MTYSYNKCENVDYSHFKCTNTEQTNAQLIFYFIISYKILRKDNSLFLKVFVNKKVIIFDCLVT
jgi:hypothetical protein